MKERAKSTHNGVNGTMHPIGPGGEENHQSHGGFRHYRNRCPPIQLYALAFDAGGIGWPWLFVSRSRGRLYIAAGVDLTSSTRVIGYTLFTDSLVVGQHNEDHRHQRAARLSSLFILAAAVAGTVMARLWGIYN